MVNGEARLVWEDFTNSFKCASLKNLKRTHTGPVLKERMTLQRASILKGFSGFSARSLAKINNLGEAVRRLRFRLL